MEIVGKTRSGKDIFVDFEFDQNGEILLVFPKFEDFDDQIDAWSVFDFISARKFRRSNALAEFRYVDGAEHFGQIVISADSRARDIYPVGTRIALAKQLVRPEFLD